MNRSDAIPFVSFWCDDAGAAGEFTPQNVQALTDQLGSARLVGWQCGFEPLFVAVYSYLPGCKVCADEAEELARDYLLERGWFTDPTADNSADYIL